MLYQSLYLLNGISFSMVSSMLPKLIWFLWVVEVISIGFSNIAFLFLIFMYFYTHNNGLYCGQVTGFFHTLSLGASVLDDTATDKIDKNKYDRRNHSFAFLNCS